MAVQETSVLAELRRRHRGQVISPEDLGYEVARATFNGMIDRRPAVVTRPLDVRDVLGAIEFAREHELPVSVRGGGHGVAGLCIGDGSLVVDLRLMREVRVDLETLTATCGGGALWEDFDPPCQRQGLATPGGTFGDTGVAGLTLGGGVGHLLGLHGLTLDAADMLPPELRAAHSGDAGRMLRVVVPVLPHISNHTDFDALRAQAQAALASLQQSREARVASVASTAF